MKISFVIITKNEERNIKRCLESISPVADEIIVLDSFSKDNTEIICREFNVRFEKLEWMGYAKTKNHGNSLAKFPYVFSIDADESLSGELQQEIKDLKLKENIADGYYMNRLTNYCGKWIKHCGWYPDWKLRLWKKEKGKWKGHIHEQLVIDSGTIAERLNSQLLHYSYYSISDHLKQIGRFTDLMAEDNYHKNKSVSLLKLIFSPIYKFISVFLLRLGIMDGYKGFIISYLSSYATFLKNKKTRQLFRKSKQH